MTVLQVVLIIEKGWLTLFHVVDLDNSRAKNGWEYNRTKRYTAGIMLLDLENPSEIIGMYNELKELWDSMKPYVANYTPQMKNYRKRTDIKTFSWQIQT